MEHDEHGRYVRAMLGELDGGIDTTGLELLRLVRMVANQYEVVARERLRAAELSAPRFGLLMRLLAEEEYGDEREGVSPTHLSRCLRVSKNTVSALLRGLEEQGLIERALDPDDRRAFRIRVSAAGRTLIHSTAPRHLTYLRDLLTDLTPDEQAQLTRLLARLHQSLLRRGVSPAEPDDTGLEVPAQAQV